MSRNKLAQKSLAVVVFLSVMVLGSAAQGSALASKGDPGSRGAKNYSGSHEADSKGTAKPKPASSPIEDAQTYRIGIEDELGISVWHESELSNNVVVRPDGMITLPLLNDLKVTGLTTKELQDLLTERLKDFVKEPQVTVIVRQIRSRKIYLIGEVVHPGTYQLNNSKTVLQLLAEAGGPGPFAKVGSIYVIRQKDGGQTRLPFHYKKAMSGSRASDDIVLQPGDMVVVP